MRMPAVLGWGTLTAVALASFEYTGGSLKGFGRDPAVDEYERKEMLRKNRRRPIEETIAEVGEGRCEFDAYIPMHAAGGVIWLTCAAIHPPGYEDRRRERLKEKYGIEINPVSADPNA
jgi:hypothetical protein